MIYELIKDKETYQVDDLVTFGKQPKVFRTAFSEISVNGAAEFDNASVLVFETGRVILTMKGGDDEQE